VPVGRGKRKYGDRGHNHRQVVQIDHQVAIFARPVRGPRRNSDRRPPRLNRWHTGGAAVLERNLSLTTQQVLDECRRRGLVVRSERELAGRTGSRHWHLRIPGRPGTLELSEWQNRVWVKVHPRRDGGWATALADELAAQRVESADPRFSRDP
jgi:hypothetical protein